MADHRNDAREARDERSLGELFTDLSQGFSTLIREEVQLAKSELSQNAKQAGKDAAFLAVGGFVAYAGLLALLAALVIGLAAVVAWWLAALIVGVVVIIIGYVLIQRGLNDLKLASLAPEQTIESLKEDKEWAKEQLK